MALLKGTGALEGNADCSAGRRHISGQEASAGEGCSPWGHGGSTWMTSSTPVMSSPRAATSVATRMSNLASLNALRVACTDGALSVSMHGLDCKAKSRLQPGAILQAKTLGLQPT